MSAAQEQDIRREHNVALANIESDKNDNLSRMAKERESAEAAENERWKIQKDGELSTLNAYLASESASLEKKELWTTEHNAKMAELEVAHNAKLADIRSVESDAARKEEEAFQKRNAEEEARFDKAIDAAGVSGEVLQELQISHNKALETLETILEKKKLELQTRETVVEGAQVEGL